MQGKEGTVVIGAIVGVLAEEILGLGRTDAETVDGLTRRASVAGSDMIKCVERFAKLRDSVIRKRYANALRSGALEAQGMGCLELQEEDLRQKPQNLSRIPMPRWHCLILLLM